MAAAPTTKTEISGADIEAQLSQLREDVSTLAKSVGALGAAKTASLKRGAKKRLDGIGEASDEAIAALGQQVTEMEQQIAGHVRERPLTALGVAAGVGFLIALMLRR